MKRLVLIAVGESCCFSLPRTASPGVSETQELYIFLEWVFVRGQRIELFSAEAQECQMASLDCQVALI